MNTAAGVLCTMEDGNALSRIINARLSAAIAFLDTSATDARIGSSKGARKDETGAAQAAQ